MAPEPPAGLRVCIHGHARLHGEAVHRSRRKEGVDAIEGKQCGTWKQARIYVVGKRPGCAMPASACEDVGVWGCDRYITSGERSG